MLPERYVWLVWASAFLVPWGLLFALLPRHRKAMLWGSLFTAPFGLTEPFFVPAYWNPPTLFDLAQRTGFDLESLIFTFGIGGTGAVLYNAITGQVPEPSDVREIEQPRHRFHFLALASIFFTFPALYALPWNPIYAAIGAILIGAIAAALCRPDLWAKTLLGGFLFAGYYAIFLQGLRAMAPGYIERVWNLPDLSGILWFGMPLEELLFACAFGAYWSGVYEHFTWSRAAAAEPPGA